MDEISDELLNQLDLEGYAVLEDAIPDELRARLAESIEELFDSEGDTAGLEFKQEAGCRRLANLVAKGDLFVECMLFDPVLQSARHVLGEGFKLSSLNVRSVDPNSETRQPLHADSGAIVDQKGYWVFNSIWLLNDVTEQNGPIRIVPGSHCWATLPQDVMQDPMDDHRTQKLITGPAGSIVLLNAHAWHGGMPNQTDQDRLTMHVFYTRRDKPQQQYQKKMIPAEVQETLSSEARDILALDDPYNDALCTQKSGMSGFLRD